MAAWRHAEPDSLRDGTPGPGRRGPRQGAEQPPRGWSAFTTLANPLATGRAISEDVLGICVACEREEAAKELREARRSPVD
jgi:hypothetical protein